MTEGQRATAAPESAVSAAAVGAAGSDDPSGEDTAVNGLEKASPEAPAAAQPVGAPTGDKTEGRSPGGGSAKPPGSETGPVPHGGEPPVTGPVAEPAAGGSAESVAESVAEPAVGGSAESVAESAAEPAASACTESVAEREAEASAAAGQVAESGAYLPDTRSAAAAAGIRVDARELEKALLDLRKPIVSLPLLLDCPGVDVARAERRKLLSQIDDYLLPRMRQAGAPVLIALVGSTGAGKSTLMNSLAGQQVSATGIRRPTTNSPVLACHPAEAGWFAENVFLPTLPRVRQQGLVMPGRDGLLVLAESRKLPGGVALLDTPDIDSVVEAHRQFASQFLDACDLWLFITTARRYADAAVWELLKDARERRAALAVVLSRVPQASVNQLAAHFDAMLTANGLGDVPRFIITETTVVHSMLPPGESDPVRHWIEELARHDERQIAILTRTMSGVLDTFKIRIPNLAEHAERQLEARKQLRSAATEAYQGAVAEFDGATSTGTMLRGEVLARWQDFVGHVDLLRTIEIRDARKKAGRSNKRPLPARAKALRAAINASLTALTLAVADRAAERVVHSWQDGPAGTALLADAAGTGDDPAKTPANARAKPDPAGQQPLGGQAAEPVGSYLGSGPEALSRSSAELVSNAADAVASWHEHLMQLVRTENRTKRSIARMARFDPDAVALVLSVSLLASGRDDAIASQSGNVPEQLLASMFGMGATRDLSTRARQFLHDQVAGVYRAESQRFTELIDTVAVPDETVGTQLFQAAFALESAR